MGWESSGEPVRWIMVWWRYLPIFRNFVLWVQNPQRSRRKYLALLGEESLTGSSHAARNSKSLTQWEDLGTKTGSKQTNTRIQTHVQTWSPTWDSADPHQTLRTYVKVCFYGNPKLKNDQVSFILEMQMWFNIWKSISVVSRTTK